MRQTTNKDTRIQVENELTQMSNDGTLETVKLMLVVCEVMHDGSKYTGQVLKSSKHAWYKNNCKQLYLQHGWGYSRWSNGAKY